MSSKKHLSTQSIVNAFPDWADIRMHEQSMGYQFANSIGKNLDDLLKQLQRINANYFLPTAIVSDIDVYYRIDLPSSYEFVKADNDDTELLYTPPTVTGVIGTTAYTVTVSGKNNIEDFWYNSVPTRLSHVDTASGIDLIASGYFFQSPLRSLLRTEFIEVPNQLYVTTSGGILYFGTDEAGFAFRTIVQIAGEDRQGDFQVEELYFVHDETLRTRTEFRTVSGVNCYGPDDIFLTVKAAGFEHNEHPVVYQGIQETNYLEDMDMFWALGSGTFSGTLLQLKKYDADDIQFRLNGYSGKFAFWETELLTTAGDRAVHPIDLAVEPWSDRVWVVDSGSLYVYNTDIHYPDTSVFPRRDYDAAAVIEPSWYNLVVGETVSIDYFWRRPVQGMKAHRVWVEKPDGTKKSLEDGSEVAYHTDTTSWIVGQPLRRKLRPTEEYTLDQRGDYIYSLEVKNIDDTTTLDQKIISVLSKKALRQFGLASIIGTHNPIIAVDIDSEYKIWVKDSSGKKYQLKEHFDNMIVDFGRRRIYFRENYDRVKVY